MGNTGADKKAACLGGLFKMQSSCESLSEEGTTKDLRATAAAGIFPVHLDHPVGGAELLVVPCSGAGGLCRPEFEVAFVGVLFSTTIKPRVQVRIGNRFFSFVADHVGHAVRPAVAIGTVGLDFAAAGAAVNV